MRYIAGSAKRSDTASDRKRVKRRSVTRPDWYSNLLAFRKTSASRASVQMLTTGLPFVAVMAGLLIALNSGMPYFGVLLLAIPTSFLLVRIFIFFHDCCHGSFFSSARANRIVGHITGALCLTPFEQWRREHLTHHATNSQLDHRGVGDVYTMTFEEYSETTAGRRAAYRLFRHPFVLFVLGPIYVFVIRARLPRRGTSTRIKRSVVVTNLLILVIGVAWSLAFGLRSYLLVQIPLTWISGAMGIWLFYVQHQFDPGFWARDSKWDSLDAAVAGSSHYKMPRVLQWLTGNIGIHHIHHLQPGIPNYRLPKALQAVGSTGAETTITIAQSIRSISINLWHEAEERFLSFRDAHRLMGSA